MMEMGASHVERPEDSKHVVGPGIRETSHAVDIAPWHSSRPYIRWNDKRAFAVLWGVVLASAHAENVRLRWGGDWDMDRSYVDQGFMDLGHIELEF